MTYEIRDKSNALWGCAPDRHTASLFAQALRVEYRAMDFIVEEAV